MSDLDFLNNSLGTLNTITNKSYNATIKPVALTLWKKHLRLNNPQWKYINAKPFSTNKIDGTAHILAMVDKRIPDIGIVGYFACTNSSAGTEVINQAVEYLKKELKVNKVYGPINGTLPSDYRLNLDADFQFPGEPVNPSWHIKSFKDAGFKTFNKYVSGKTNHYQLLLKLVVRKPSKKYSHISIRQFDNHHYNNDFKIYHDLRNAIFPKQSIYCPAISFEERIYNSSDKFDPKYTYFLVDNEREVGFIMAYVYEDKLILKTIGLLKDYRGKRLSGLLINRVHEQAKQDGIKTIIYALVRVGNPIYRKRRPGVKIFRHYQTMYK
jgi:GNAT superfamily N-acetyltransferase